MKNFTKNGLARTGVVASGFIAILSVLYSCADRLDDVKVPPGTVTTAATELAAAKAWYGGLTVGARTAPTSGATTSAVAPAKSTKWPLALEWANAAEGETDPTGRVWLVPVHETIPRFVHGPDYGHRYLVVRTEGGFSASILETYSKHPDSRAEALAVAKAALADMLHARLRPVNDFEGAIILYDVNYRYTQGRRYVRGQAPLLGEHMIIGKSSGSQSKSSPGVKTSVVACGAGCTTYHTTYSSEDQCDCPDDKLVEDGGSGAGGDGGGYNYGGGYTGDGGDWGGGGGATAPPGSGGGGGGSPSPSSPATIITGNLNSCVQAQLTRLQNLKGNDIGGLFRFFSSTPYTTWNIQSAYLADDNGRQVNAVTSSSAGLPADYISTALNITFTSNATNVAVARTLIHESMHAYLIRWAYSRSMNVNATTSQLVDAYLGAANPNDPAGQHEAMVNIINQMAGALQADFPDLDLTTGGYAQNLFWGGLTQTAAYAALPDSQKSAILTAAAAESYTQPNAKGAKACN